MPNICFSYQPDLPPGIETRNVAPPALRRMPAGPCFSYPADVPRSMPVSCFSYSAGTPRPAPPGLHKMAYTTCFRY
jgi:hypothetical protein